MEDYDWDQDDWDSADFSEYFEEFYAEDWDEEF